MTRVKENADFIKCIEQVETTGTLEEGKVFYLDIIASALVDISKSLAIIADSMKEVEQ